MNSKISILVPVYNVETYLSRCIDSVLSQDFTEYELILVDDGSSDSCPWICDEYDAKDERIRVKHTPNKGVASARLTGFQMANGLYLIFMDSDDYLLPGALRFLYDTIERGYDIVKASPLRVTNKDETWVEHYEYEEGEISNRDIYIELLMRDKIAPYLHCGIYRVSLFDTSYFEILVKHNISIGDDWVVNYLISLNVKKVLFVTKPIYAYFINESSMMHQKVISWIYNDRIRAATVHVREKLPDKLKDLEKNIAIVNQLKFFFIPELPFNMARFLDLQSNFHQALKVVGNNGISKKFYFLINHRILFFIYTRLFCFTYFILKRRCKRRKVLS